METGNNQLSAKIYMGKPLLENDLHKQEVNDFEKMLRLYYKTNGVITINLMTIYYTTFKT